MLFVTNISRLNMIGPNLGVIERAVRLLLGFGLAAWIFIQPALGVLEVLALLAASFLILNGVFGRCYLWLLLNLNTYEQCKKNCGRRADER